MAEFRVMFGNRLYLGIGATIIGLLAILASMLGVSINSDGDKICDGTLEDPCISYFNVTNWNYRSKYIYNYDNIQMDFSPEIQSYKLYVKYYGRWRFTNFTMSTRLGNIPELRKYVFVFPAYSTKEFKLVGYKNDPLDTIKWGFGVDKDYLDPIWGSINVSKIKGNCVNHTQDTFHTVEHTFTCPTPYVNWSNYPCAYCYNWEPANQSFSMNYSRCGFDRWDKPSKTIWWNNSEINGTEIITTCETIGYQIKNKKLYFENFPFRCWLNVGTKCVQCKSTKDGDGKPPIKTGDGTSWCEACIVNGSIVNTCREDANFMKYWRLQ